MDYGFAFFIIAIALVVFFIDEITTCVKNYWNNYFLRHMSFMMFLAFFGLSYPMPAVHLFQKIIHYSNVVASTCAPFIPIIDNKFLVMFAIIHIFLSLFVFATFYSLYFILKRHKYLFGLELLWVVWLVIAVFYTQAI